MSGWIKYPYKECEECEKFDWDRANDVVPQPYMACSYSEDCPITEPEGDNG